MMSIFAKANASTGSKIITQGMAVLGKWSALLIAPLVAFASPAQAQSRIATLDDIFPSYNDCFAATESGSLSPSKLEELGWVRANMEDGDGKKIGDEPIIFSHSKRAPIILLSAIEGKGLCAVIAKIEDYKVIEQFKAAFGGKLPKPDAEGAVTFKAEGRSVQIAPTGTRKKPSLRLVVFTPAESK